MKFLNWLIEVLIKLKLKLMPDWHCSNIYIDGNIDIDILISKYDRTGFITRHGLKDYHLDIDDITYKTKFDYLKTLDVESFAKTILNLFVKDTWCPHLFLTLSMPNKDCYNTNCWTCFADFLNTEYKEN